MAAIGVTNLNCTTYYDRTNFFEALPTSGLDRTLYLEAHRMGHLLDDFSEETLTTQRGVAQNEKRQDENAPYALADEVITKSAWPASHPYSHTVLGEMTDLDAAKNANVKDWFSKYYGPTNAVIVIAGDITPEQARSKVEQYFGPSRRGRRSFGNAIGLLREHRRSARRRRIMCLKLASSKFEIRPATARLTETTLTCCRTF